MERVDAERPDVVVTDIRMPPSDTDEGIRAAERIRETHPDVGVVVLSLGMLFGDGVIVAAGAAIGGKTKASAPLVLSLWIIQAPEAPRLAADGRVTAMAKYMLRAFTIRNPNPASALYYLNNALANDLEADRFATLVYGVFDKPVVEGEMIEPSVSVPIAAAHRLAATATADPELDPEGFRSSA